MIEFIDRIIMNYLKHSEPQRADKFVSLFLLEALMDEWVAKFGKELTCM